MKNTIKRIAFASLITLSSISPNAYSQPDNIRLSDYETLVSAKVPKKVIERFEEEEIYIIALGLRNGNIPGNIIKILDDKPWKDSQNFARKDPLYRKSSNQLRESLEKKLKEREHLTRDGTNYYENPEQLGLIKNKELLVLLSKHLEYFDNPDSMDFIESLFPENNESSESGGIVVKSNGDIKYIPIDTSWEIELFPEYVRQSFSNKNNYVAPIYVPNINSIGFFHTHIVGKDEEKTSLSGPSGNIIPIPFIEIGDTATLRTLSKYNSYHIHTLITRLDDNEYNVDLYFRDVIKKTFKEPTNSQYTTVLDIGVFRK